MTKLLITLLIFCAPVTLMAQFPPGGDTVGRNIFSKDCYNAIFTKVEDYPGMSPLLKAFQDSLSAYIKYHKATGDFFEGYYNFLLTKDKQIFDIKGGVANTRRDSLLRQFLLSNSKMLRPGIVKGSEVCAIMNMWITITWDNFVYINTWQ